MGKRRERLPDVPPPSHERGLILINSHQKQYFLHSRWRVDTQLSTKSQTLYCGSLLAQNICVFEHYLATPIYSDCTMQSFQCPKCPCLMPFLPLFRGNH